MEFFKTTIIPKVGDLALMLFLGFMTVIAIIAQQLYVTIDEGVRAPFDNVVSDILFNTLNWVDNLPLTNYFSLSFVWLIIGIVVYSVGVYFFKSVVELDKAALTIFRYHKPANFSFLKYSGILIGHAIYHIVTVLLFLLYLQTTIDRMKYVDIAVSGAADGSSAAGGLVTVVYYGVAIAAWFYIGAVLLRLITLRPRVIFI